MELYLVESPDHALLTLAIREASKCADEQKTYLGRTALMKIAYFLRQHGAPFNYRFEMYHYGPFCADVLRDIEWLKADNVIRDTSTSQSTYSNYRLSENADELLSLHSGLVDEWRDKFAELAKMLIGFRPSDLEVIATLDYLHRQQKAASPTDLRDRVIAEFQKHKADKYDLTEIAGVYDELLKAQFLK